MSKRIEFQVSDELSARIERARGDVSRSRWLTRAVEYFLQLHDPASNGMLPPPSRPASAFSEVEDRGRVPKPGSLAQTWRR